MVGMRGYELNEEELLFQRLCRCKIMMVNRYDTYNTRQIHLLNMGDRTWETRTN